METGDLVSTITTVTRNSDNPGSVEVNIDPVPYFPGYPVYIAGMWINTISLVLTDIPTATESEDIPETLLLHENYPNPFNPSTFIRWAQPQTGQVRLSVYNMLGQEVATLIDEIRPAGTHEAHLDASGWTSGVYVYVLETGEQTLTQKNDPVEVEIERMRLSWDEICSRGGGRGVGRLGGAGGVFGRAGHRAGTRGHTGEAG